MHFEESEAIDLEKDKVMNLLENTLFIEFEEMIKKCVSIMSILSQYSQVKSSKKIVYS